jgi:hypothetical protein
MARIKPAANAYKHETWQKPAQIPTLMEKLLNENGFHGDGNPESQRDTPYTSAAKDIYSDPAIKNGSWEQQNQKAKYVLIIYYKLQLPFYKKLQEKQNTKDSRSALD